MTDFDPLMLHQLKALRNADHVCFSAKGDNGGEIRAIRDALHSSTGFEETVTIDVGASAGAARTGFEMMSSYHEVWHTIVQLVLKVGDRIDLLFLADNGTNDYCRDAGLHADEFQLRITRGPEGKRRQMYFLLETRVGPNNSARMIQEAR